MKRKKSTIGNLSLLISFILFSFQAIGQQSDFFTVTTIPQGLSQERLQFTNILSQDSMTKSTDYVQFQDLTQQLAPDGTLSLKILTEQNRFDLFPVHYELQSNGDYTWLGKMDNEKGYAGLIQMQGRLAGFVQSNGAFWEIVPLEVGVSIIREMDISKFQKENCGIDHILKEYSLGEIQEMVDLCDEDGGCGGIIDVLILVPPDVPEWYGTEFDNPWAAVFHVIGSLFSFQAALINSGVEDVGLRFRTAPFDFEYSDPLNIDEDLFETLPNTATGIREEFRADLVILLTSMDYPGIRGASLAGEIVDGEFNWLAPCEDCAFLIAEVQNNLNPTWTLAHEIAHLFGARHNRSDNVPCGTCGSNVDICTHGWRFAEGGQDRTIMSLLYDDIVDEGSQRVLHYSNPDVQFDGFDTGTEDDNNTVGIRNATCQIQHYQSSPELGVTISGVSTPLCLFGGFSIPRTYTANVSEPTPGFPGAPPYTYEWRWNLNGNFIANPGTLIGTNPSITVNSVLGCPQFFLRVNVTSSDSEIVSATRVINTVLCFACNGPQFLTDNNSAEVQAHIVKKASIDDALQKDIIKSQSKYAVYPNPASSKLHIQRVSESGEIYRVRVFDANGKVLFDIPNQSANQLKIDLNNSTEGLIWIQIQDQKGVSVKKVIVIKKQ
jgi:hypothetical protein